MVVFIGGCYYIQHRAKSRNSFQLLSQHDDFPTLQLTALPPTPPPPTSTDRSGVDVPVTSSYSTSSVSTISSAPSSFPTSAPLSPRLVPSPGRPSHLVVYLTEEAEQFDMAAATAIAPTNSSGVASSGTVAAATVAAASVSTSSSSSSLQPLAAVLSPTAYSSSAPSSLSMPTLQRTTPRDDARGLAEDDDDDDDDDDDLAGLDFNPRAL